MQKELFELYPERAANFAAAQTILAPVATPLIWKAMTEAIADIGRRVEEDRGFKILLPHERAQWLHRQIVVRVDDHLKEIGGGLVAFKWHSPHRMNVLNIEDQVHLCFKRVRRGLQRSNYHTAHQEEYWTQTGEEKPLKMIIGYWPNETWNHANIYLTLPTGRAGRRIAEWAPIFDQSAQLISLAAGKKAEAPQNEERVRFVAKPKTRDSRKTKRSEGDVG